MSVAKGNQYSLDKKPSASSDQNTGIIKTNLIDHDKYTHEKISTKLTNDEENNKKALCLINKTKTQRTTNNSNLTMNNQVKINTDDLLKIPFNQESKNASKISKSTKTSLETTINDQPKSTKTSLETTINDTSKNIIQNIDKNSDNGEVPSQINQTKPTLIFKSNFLSSITINKPIKMRILIDTGAEEINLLTLKTFKKFKELDKNLKLTKNPLIVRSLITYWRTNNV